MAFSIVETGYRGNDRSMDLIVGATSLSFAVYAEAMNPNGTRYKSAIAALTTVVLRRNENPIAATTPVRSAASFASRCFPRSSFRT